MNNGRISLVGAGPGDPNLLTLKGLDRIRRAHIVFCDALLTDDWKGLFPDHVRVIPILRDSDDPNLIQQQLVTRMLDEARKGMRVVHLKNGDPFLFGRGGEELLDCLRAGVHTEVISGVTAVTAVPGTLQIPLTHRDIAGHLQIWTGRHRDNRPASFEHVDPKATHVGIMIRGQLQKFLDALLAGGIPGNTMAAAIQWGTTGKQQSVRTRLTDLYNAVEAAGLSSPMTVVVGAVVDFSLEIEKFLPLSGRRIVYTRPADHGQQIVDLWRSLGANVVHMPVSGIRPALDWSSFDTAVARGGDAAHVAFTSANAVRASFQRLGQLDRDVRVWPRAKIWAVGPATQEALTTVGCKPIFTPEEPNARALADAIGEPGVGAGHVVFPRGADIRPDLMDALAKAGWSISAPVVYEAVPTCPEPSDLERIWREPPDAFVFYSPRAFELFSSAANLDALGLQTRCPSAFFIAVGPTTESALRARGISRVVAPGGPVDSPWLKVLIETL